MLTRLKILESRPFFSIPRKEFLHFWESRLGTVRQQAYSERDNCPLSLCACYQLIACLLHCSCGPLTRCRDAAKQWTVVYLSGKGQRGQMFLPPGADNPSYATASARQCKFGRFSWPLYKEWERSLRCRPIVQPCLMAGLWSPVLSIRSAIASPVAFQACVSNFRQVRHSAGDLATARPLKPYLFNHLCVILARITGCKCRLFLHASWHLFGSLFISVLHMTVSPAKIAEPIKMPLGNRLMWTQGTMY